MADKTAVITGSSQGIGAATAEVFARAGYNVVVTYFKSKDKAEELARRCEAHGVLALVVEADCSSEAGLQHLVQEATTKFGDIDVLINNFGTVTETKTEGCRSSTSSIRSATHLLPPCLPLICLSRTSRSRASS